MEEEVTIFESELSFFLVADFSSYVAPRFVMRTQCRKIDKNRQTVSDKLSDCNQITIVGFSNLTDGALWGKKGLINEPTSSKVFLSYLHYTCSHNWKICERFLGTVVWALFSSVINCLRRFDKSPKMDRGRKRLKRSWKMAENVVDVYCETDDKLFVKKNW